MTKQKLDFPFDECVEAVKELLHNDPTVSVYQKFSCAQCGARQTIETPNVFHKTGICEECQHITDIEKQGCNYMIHYVIRGGKVA